MISEGLLTFPITVATSTRLSLFRATFSPVVMASSVYLGLWKLRNSKKSNPVPV